MRNILIVVLMIAQFNLTAGAGGQAMYKPVSCVFRNYAPSSGPNEVSIDVLKARLLVYQKRQNAGAGLTAAGAVLFVVGEVLVFTAFGLEMSGKRNYNDSSQDPMWDAGIASLIPGAGFLAGGIPLYVLSRHKARFIGKQIRERESNNGTNNGIMIIK